MNFLNKLFSKESKVDQIDLRALYNVYTKQAEDFKSLTDPKEVDEMHASAKRLKKYLKELILISEYQAGVSFYKKFAKWALDDIEDTLKKIPAVSEEKSGIITKMPKKDATFIFLSNFYEDLLEEVEVAGDQLELQRASEIKNTLILDKALLQAILLDKKHEDIGELKQEFKLLLKSLKPILDEYKDKKEEVEILKNIPVQVNEVLK